MAKQFYDSNFVLGMLGGGQLGRMLIQETINYNVSVFSLDPDANAPCKDIANYFEQGSLQDFDKVYNFGKKADVLTIEIEHVNTEALLKLEEEGVEVYPQPKLLQLIQDKGLQKQFYRSHNIPTADFYLVENKSEINQYLNEFPFMQKMRKGGYDGKGVTPLKNEASLEKAFDCPSVLEKFVDFEKEISVIVARNKNGETATFPLVELEFNPEANLVEFLFAPAIVSKSVEEQAYSIAKKLINELGLVGILAVELFVTKSGEVLVNEIAPRPHNSGHHTIEANITSQYEQHMRAILNMPLGSTAPLSAAVMVNILGEKGFEGPAYYENLNELIQQEGVKLHLYGKKITKPFRKMGHYTVIHNDLNKAKQIARETQKILKVKTL